MQKKPLFPIARKHFLTAVAIISVVFGVYLRFFQLETPSPWMDEGYTALAVEALYSTHKEILPGGLPYNCGIYCYLSLPFVALFGATPFALRLLAVLASIATIFVVYHFSRHLFNRNTASIATIITSLSYWQIAWARQARWYSLLELFFITSLYFFYQAIHKKSQSQFLFAILFTLLTIKTHFTGILLPVIFCIFALVHKETRERLLSLLKRRQKMWHLGIFFSLCILIVIVQGLYYLATTMQHMNLASYYASFYGPRYLLLLLLACCAIVFTLRKSAPYRNITLLMSIAASAYIIPLSFFSDILHYRYLFLITPLIIILASYTVSLLIPSGSAELPVTKKSIIKTLLLVVVVGIYLSSTATHGGPVLTPERFYALESDSPDKTTNTNYYAYTPQPDWNEAYSIIQKNTSDGDVILSSHPHFTYLYSHTPGYWFPVDYLGSDTTTTSATTTDPYVGALPVGDIAALQELTQSHHGFIVFDYQARDGRIPEDMQDYIESNLTLIYHKTTNEYSKIWVYGF